MKAKAQAKNYTSDITLYSTENSTVQIANTVFGSNTKVVASTGAAVSLENTVSSKKASKSLLSNSSYSITSSAHTHTDDCYANGRYICTDDGGKLTLVNMSINHSYIADMYRSWVDSIEYSCSNCSTRLVHVYFENDLYSITNAPKSYHFIIQLPQYDANIFNTIDNVTAEIRSSGVVKTGAISGIGCVTNQDEVIQLFVSKMKAHGYNIYPMSLTPYYSLLHENICDGTNGRMCLTQGYDGNQYTYYTVPHYIVKEAAPICDKVVTSITATDPIQSIIQGQSIATTATATYLDGHTATLNCTTDFDTNITGNGRTATLYYTGLVGNAHTNGTLTCIVTVNVIPKLIGITITPSSTVVYNGSEPTYTVVANYADGTKKSVSEGNYTKTGWSSGYGIKTVNFSYTESGKTVSKTVTITVKPNLTDLIVTASDTRVYYGTNISFVTKAEYEDGSTATVNSSNETPYSKTTVGEQNISYSYSENNITKRASVNVTVLDYPVSLRIGLKQDWIYQGQRISIQSAKATLASGKEIDISPSISDYDNITVDNISIRFSYSLNGREVSTTAPVEVKPDLYDLKLSGTDFTIYKGHSLGLSVTASFHVEGDQKLSSDEYSISGFDNNTYDRDGKYYTVSYSNKGVTKTKSVFIKVLPNISDISVYVAAQTTEGTYIPFTMVVTYEDGKTKTLSQADVGIAGNGLSVNNYDINKVGYQDVTFAYSEGGKTLTKVITVRVRAIIRVSIPVSMLVTIDPNGHGFISPDLKIENQSKESVLVGINSVSSDSSSGLKNVLPSAHTDWSKLGLSYENDLALGLECKSNWVNDYLKNPLYVCQVTDKKDIGVLDKKSSGCVGFTAKYCNAQSKQRNFAYVINWFIKLSED